jgi:hypothetical protein
MEMAKDIFAQQGIKEYSADALVALVGVILEREKEYQRIEEELHRRMVAGEPIN